MIETLKINGVNASTKGIRMGDEFISTLKRPIPIKDYISNESRLENGIRCTMVNVRKAKRSITLTFVVMGNTTEEYESNLQWLYEQFYQGVVKIQCKTDLSSKPIDTYPTYTLVYTGKSINYSESTDRTICKVGVGFDEPNPNTREGGGGARPVRPPSSYEEEDEDEEVYFIIEKSKLDGTDILA